jgi:hypothetical protein
VRTSDLRPGDLVEVLVRGVRFEAPVVEPKTRLYGRPVVRIKPPKGITYYHVSPTSIVRRVDRQSWIPELGASGINAPLTANGGKGSDVPF